MKDRKYLTYRTIELSSLADSKRNYKNILDEILDELSYRRRKVADKTREKVIGYLTVIPNNPYSITKRTVTAGTHVFSFAGDEKHGILARLGYKVGFDGLSRAHRRDILDFAFENALPPTTSAEYMAEWGPKRSEKRLRKLANCLSTFAANARNNTSGNYKLAIDHWVEDLHYLKVTHYIGQFKFKWPEVSDH